MSSLYSGMNTSHYTVQSETGYGTDEKVVMKECQRSYFVPETLRERGKGETLCSVIDCESRHEDVGGSGGVVPSFLSRL
jgi:ssDNA-binding replication factor A large subunit